MKSKITVDTPHGALSFDKDELLGKVAPLEGDILSVYVFGSTMRPPKLKNVRGVFRSHVEVVVPNDVDLLVVVSSESNPPDRDFNRKYNFDGYIGWYSDGLVSLDGRHMKTHVIYKTATEFEEEKKKEEKLSYTVVTEGKQLL